jgi:hypothetical protein
MTWWDKHPVLYTVLSFLSFAIFFVAMPGAFFWAVRDDRTPEQVTQAQKESDDQDRKFYADSLANAAAYQAALRECRALQIKYRLSGSAVVCAKWEMAKQIEATIADGRDPD